MRAIMYMYDIPTSVLPKDYPAPSVALRKFAARLEYSCWVVPEGQMHQTEPVTEELRAVGAQVDTVRFDESEEGKIREMAKRAILREAARVRAYIDASIESCRTKLAEAQRLMSVGDVNKAIRFQQTAINRAKDELADAESCAIGFDLLGDLAELVASVRAVIVARAEAFVAERKTARAVVRAAAAVNGAAQASLYAHRRRAASRQAEPEPEPEGEES